MSSEEFKSGGDPLATTVPSEMGGVRRILLALTFLGTVGLAIELLLLDHVDSWTQWIPLVALALGIASTIAVAVAPGRVTLAFFQFVMIVYVTAGLLGLYLHYSGNAEFEREENPALAGWALAWRSLRGATPALAPGSLAQLGLLGMLFAWRHPALASSPGTASSPQTESAALSPRVTTRAPRSHLSEE